MGAMFSNSGDMVKGTGQTVGDLKNAGWTADDMRSMGLQAEPSKGVAFGRNALRGSLMGLSNGLQSQGQMRGGSPMIQVDNPQLDPYFTDPQVAAQIEAERRKQLLGY